jgi:hypothetical protein
MKKKVYELYLRIIKEAVIAYLRAQSPVCASETKTDMNPQSG